MKLLSLLKSVNWENLAKTWLPILSAIGGVGYGLWQYHINSRHDRASTYLSVMDKFMMNKQDFDQYFKIVSSPYIDHGPNSEAHKMLTACGIDENKSWGDQIACFNKQALINYYSSIVAVMDQFVILARYASSDDYAQDMLKIALHDKADLLASKLCGALTTVQKRRNKTLEAATTAPPGAADPLGAIEAINKFANADQTCTWKLGQLQGGL